jgi:hypothetical protein
MREIRSPVQRVNIPAVWRIQLRAAAFLGYDSMLGKLLAEAIDNKFFTGAIGGGDQIIVAFQLERHASMGHQDLAGFARDLNRGVQIMCHILSLQHMAIFEISSKLSFIVN